MKLAVSNIAWKPEEELEAITLLKSLGIDHIEIAPTKKWPDLTLAKPDEVAHYNSFWLSHHLQVLTFQSMLFGRPDLTIFENEAKRLATLEYLLSSIELAGAMKVRCMVFGSPKNRIVGDLAPEVSNKIAVDFFTRLGEKAHEHGVIFCMEPNAADYGTDFVTTAAEGAALVREVNNPGFGLHLDTGCMTMAQDDIYQSIIDSQDVLKNFHISSPFLEAVDELSEVNHDDAVRGLEDIGYKGALSIEMKPQDDGNNLKRVKRAVIFAQDKYGALL